MLVECSNCGAPLDVVSGARQVKCGYCRATTPIRGMRTISSQSPANWQPPPVWTPPPQAPQQSVALPYTATTAHGGSGPGVGLLIGLSAVIVLGGAAAFFVAANGSSQSMPSDAEQERRAEPPAKPAKPASKSGARSDDLKAASAEAPVADTPPPRPASTPTRRTTPKPAPTPKAAATPSPTTKPTPPTKSKCNCKPGDLMCQMKCAQ